MIVGRKNLPPNNLKELIAWLKANPGATFGNAGIGSPGHVSSIFFQNTIGVKIQPVQYRSAGPASQDLLAGNIDLMMDTAATSGPHVRNGLLKAFAMTSNKRSLAMPDVPTVDEAGLQGFYFYFWHAMWVPKGTPKDVIAKLNDALVKALADPVTHKRLVDIGQEFFAADMRSPEALAKFQKQEIDKWWPVIKAAGIKAQ
jgi:tripartite-type tricarboxylate transporter receptor subunit TctC